MKTAALFIVSAFMLVSTILQAQDTKFSGKSKYAGPFGKIGVKEKQVIINGYDDNDKDKSTTELYGWVYDRTSGKVVAVHEEKKDTVTDKFGDDQKHRWLSVDPVMHANESPYVGIGNNPIIYVDPDGRTNYYNTSGAWIGTDGIDNGTKLIALTQGTAKTIMNATAQCQNITMNTQYYLDLVTPYSNNEIDAMDKTFDKSAITLNEEGFTAGDCPYGGDKMLISYPGNKRDGYDPEKGYYDIMLDDGIGSYDCHSHPPSLEFDPINNNFNRSIPDASDADFKTSIPMENIYGLNKPSIVLGWENTNANTKHIPPLNTQQQNWMKTNPNQRLPLLSDYKNTKKISLYNSQGQIGQFNYSSFKTGNTKVLDDNTSSDNNCK